MLSTQVLPDRTRTSKRDHDEMSSGSSNTNIPRKYAVNHQLKKTDCPVSVKRSNPATDSEASRTDRLTTKFEASNIGSQIVPGSEQAEAHDGLNVLIRRRLIKSVQRQPRYRFQIAAANLEAEELHQENNAWYDDEIEEIDAELDALKEKIRGIKRRKVDVDARYTQQQNIIYHENNAVQDTIDENDKETRRLFVQQAFHPHLALESDDSDGGAETVYPLGGLSTMGVAEDYRDRKHSHFIPASSFDMRALQIGPIGVFTRRPAITPASHFEPKDLENPTKSLTVASLTLPEILPIRPASTNTPDATPRDVQQR